MTTAEKKVWYKILRNKNFFGLRFERQKPIGKYIVDFYCPKLKLVIEIDGDTHYSEQALAYDAQRTDYLCSLGITVIRYTNNEVLEDIDSIYEDLDSQVNKLK